MVRVGVDGGTALALPRDLLLGVLTSSETSDSLEADLVLYLVGVDGVSPTSISSFGLDDFFGLPLLDGVLLTEALMDSASLSAGLTDRELDLVTLVESVSIVTCCSSDICDFRAERVKGTSCEVVLTGLVSRDLLRLGEG